MSDSIQYRSQDQVINLIEKATQQGKLTQLLDVLLTPDEKEALIPRVNIILELLLDNKSQRQISQMLGVGVATITRGSNELKRQPEDVKAWLLKLIQTQSPKDELHRK